MTNDQAENLREKVVDSQIDGNQKTQSLPSRSEVHGKRRDSQKKQKEAKSVKRKTTFLATRLLLCAFILLIGITLTYKLWSKDIYIPVHSEDKKGIEQVEIEQ
ncbi:hypothetical protein QUF49_08725 [Fictibacillus sp. b24]|uniref:hypothetical protein n=1 Tax=unclassified Fictibacillus TaxID=2644029 RepID=UPI0025A2FC09|nr:hypothetical protein [Fictibacillus sp. b24]MDM5316073.1 hypothetical protein [Fictibacillus sp. b24]